MSYCELAGFLFAVASSPEMVQPSEWIPLVFNKNEGGFATLDEAQEILPAIMALYNHANHGVLERTPALPPGCVVRTEPLANLEPDAPLSQWARGFTQGHDWLSKLWNEYTPKSLSNELGADMLVLSFFSTPQLAEAFRKEGKQKDKPLAEMAGEMLHLLPEAMKSYAHLGRSIHEALREPSLERQPARSEKIGRNDLCPCGSGKKYKKCCGAVLH
jgi:uncharacterized protein